MDTFKTDSVAEPNEILKVLNRSVDKATHGDTGVVSAKADASVIGREQNALPDSTPHSESNVTHGGTGVDLSEIGSSGKCAQESYSNVRNGDSGMDSMADSSADDRKQNAQYTTAAIVSNATEESHIAGTNLVAWYC